MKKTVHENLTDAIKFHTPNSENAVDTLIRIIPLSKEAAYRRLRGEIQFSLTEAVRISQEFGLSLDSISGIDKSNFYVFHIKQFFKGDPFEKYYDLLKVTLSEYEQMKKDPNSQIYSAGNILPTPFYFKYKYLSRYAFFKWFFQSFYSNKTTKFQDIIIPEKIRTLQHAIYQEAFHIDSNFIIGRDFIFALVNDINYFESIGLITREEISMIKTEVQSMLNNLDEISKRACFPTTGKKVFVYVSDAYFDGNYTCISNEKFKVSIIHLYGINRLTCIDSTIYENQKRWIESLISFSTLISGTGRLYASEFFAQQRKLLETLDI